MTPKLCVVCDKPVKLTSYARSSRETRYIRVHVDPGPGHKAEAPESGWGVIPCHWCSVPLRDHYPDPCPLWDSQAQLEHSLRLV